MHIRSINDRSRIVRGEEMKAFEDCVLKSTAIGKSIQTWKRAQTVFACTSFRFSGAKRLSMTFVTGKIGAYCFSQLLVQY